MYAWVLILWIGGGYAENVSINDIATQGDCEYLAGKLKERSSDAFYVEGQHICVRYKKAAK
jgi:hypothetical protein